MNRFKNILFVAGAAEDPVGPLARAVELARRNGARLTLAAAVDRLPPWSALLTRGLTNADLQQAVLEQRRAELERLARGLDADLRAEVRVLVGSPFLEIVHAVLRDGYDLVIKGAEGGGAGGGLFGSTDLHLLRKCPVPVWIDRPGRVAGYRRVLAAVDPRPDEPQRDNLDRLILELAGSMAAAYEAELHVLHAWSVPGEATLTGPFMNMPPEEVAAMGRAVRRRRDAELRALLERHVPRVPDYRVHLLKGPASRVIPAFVRRRRVDLVVMGTVGRTGLPGFFIGNTAENVLNHVTSSVLAVKPEGFVSPVSAAAG
jgi:nucleotide-binding universal stress UspA family protein